MRREFNMNSKTKKMYRIACFILAALFVVPMILSVFVR